MLHISYDFLKPQEVFCKSTGFPDKEEGDEIRSPVLVVQADIVFIDKFV